MWYLLCPSESYRLLPKEDFLEILREGSPTYLLGAHPTDGPNHIAVLWSDLREQYIERSWFEPSGNADPDFEDIEVIDCGQTLRLGRYEVDVLNIPYLRDLMLNAGELGEAFAKGTDSRRPYRLGDSLDPYVDDIGGDVQYFGSSAHPPLLKVFKDKGFVIGVHHYLNLERVRYEIAMALGHYVLHSEMGRKPQTFLLTRQFRTLYTEAARFARGFLMPKEEFLESYKNYGENTQALAARYMLQPSVIHLRLRDLGVK